MSLERVIGLVLEYAVPILELMGIFILVQGGVVSFVRYVQSMAARRPPHVKAALARSMLLSLEFIMAAEILETIEARELKDVLLLGGIVLIRFVLSFELKQEEKEEESGEGSKED